MQQKIHKDQKGAIIAGILIATIFLTSLFLSLTILANANLFRAKSRVYQLQAQYSAESGVDAVIANFNDGDTGYAGSGGETVVLETDQFKTTFETTVVDGADDKQKVITSTGKVYSPASDSEASFYRTIEVIAERSSDTSTSSILSRNIIDIDSGVKNIWATDIFANGYINMNKNTTTLLAENITVASKNTGASNCSIGGSGDLEKPPSFTDPAQTKTKITTAFNNCVSPPGNSSNSDFDVTINAPVAPVVSSYIPWGQYMDTSYTDAGSCTDWTSGGATRNIPSVTGSKATYYPNSASQIASSCGSSGNINLGSNQYNINENVHVRANFCSSSQCNPTFNNTSGSIKYVFIEGTINFESLTSTPGSDPIVLLTYGTDPNSHKKACPSITGDSIYIGQKGNQETIAPAIYLLAKNGLCVDKTKFSGTSAPSIGGMSGKNIYIASSPGNPYDLKLDPSFPVNLVPVDLSWRATIYRRL